MTLQTARKYSAGPIVPSLGAVQVLVKAWLSSWTPKHTSRSAQHYRKLIAKEADLTDVIKYETKIFTKPEGKTGRKSEGAIRIYGGALDNIHTAMTSCRLLNRFGFNAPTKVKDRKECFLIDDFFEWHYGLQSFDWVTEDYESILAGDTHNHPLQHLLEAEMDIEPE